MRRHPGPTLARVLVAVEWRCLRFWIISSRNGPHQGDKLISDCSSVTGSPACAVEFNRLAEWVVPVRAGTGIPGFQARCLKPLGHPCRDPAFVYSTESESQQARTQQHQACRGQCEESVRDNVVVAHDTPTTPDARPNLLKLSKFPIGTTESFAQLEFGRTPEPLAVQAHALER